jgi:hypothetical protein
MAINFNAEPAKLMCKVRYTICGHRGCTEDHGVSNYFSVKLCATSVQLCVIKIN